MIRPLGAFERALRLSDLYSPFNIVAALELESPPPPAEIQRALAALQTRHPFLRARVELRGKRPWFVEIENPALPFTLIEENTNWLDVVERELHRRMDSAGPLFRWVYIYNASRAVLILTFQHAIVDATSAARLLHETLTLATDPLASFPTLQPAPAAQARFPPSSGLLRYAARQLADEFRYQLASRGHRRPPLRLGGQPRVLTATLDSALTESLARRARKENVTLNSLLQAAILQAVNRCLYNGERTPMRTFAFPDLRSYVTPPLDAENLGAYISMLRYTFTLDGTRSVWDLARAVTATLQDSFQRGDKYSAHLMSENLMKMMLRLKSTRMGATALSYTGVNSLEKQYGETKVRALHGFIANIDLGPEFTAQASLFGDELILDMVYLDSDMDRPKAEAIAGEIREILVRAILKDADKR
ncbi:MAG: hypothetical protein AB1750_16040 [Chloroflexota bacterium]